MKVGMADAADFDLDQHIVGTWHRAWHVFHAQGGAELVEQGSLHGGSSLGSGGIQQDSRSRPVAALSPVPQATGGLFALPHIARCQAGRLYQPCPGGAIVLQRGATSRW